MDLLWQIKARVVNQIVRMENLPFLTKNVESQSRNAPPPLPENEWPTHMDSPRHFDGFVERPQQKKDILESFKENQIGLILLGMVIGFLLANMRPVVFQAK
jgi:hypothetical protein